MFICCNLGPLRRQYIFSSPSDSSTEEQWERVGLEQADSAQILVIITSEDDVRLAKMSPYMSRDCCLLPLQGCVTELRPEGRLVIHGAPKDVEDRLLELAEKRRENNSIIRVSGKGLFMSITVLLMGQSIQ